MFTTVALIYIERFLKLHVPTPNDISDRKLDKKMIIQTFRHYPSFLSLLSPLSLVVFHFYFIIYYLFKNPDPATNIPSRYVVFMTQGNCFVTSKNICQSSSKRNTFKGYPIGSSVCRWTKQEYFLVAGERKENISDWWFIHFQIFLLHLYFLV